MVCFNIPLTFSKTISSYVHKLTLDGYTATLHQLRNIVREKEIHLLKRGSVGREFIREIAETAQLPPKLKKHLEGLSIAEAILGVVGAFLRLKAWETNKK